MSVLRLIKVLINIPMVKQPVSPAGILIKFITLLVGSERIYLFLFLIVYLKVGV